MKPEQQRIEIAGVCGWTEITTCTCSPSVPRGRKNKAEFTCHLPDYINDLNAMHEAEKVLKYQQETQYANHLADFYEGITHLAVFATAAHRAEAFLRTVGKWVESETP